MLEPRVIPCLLLRRGALVKTTRFSAPAYVGDPINAVRIFNELEVDELVVLDIGAARERTPPPFTLIEQLASECFMPLTYGGGIASVEDIRRLHRLGVEKVVLNSVTFERPEVLSQAAQVFGSQSVIVGIDTRRHLLGGYSVYTHGGSVRYRRDPALVAKAAESLGAGEILLTSIDREGTWEGYDLNLVEVVASAVRIPVIASGGAGSVRHFVEAVDVGASAIAAGSMAVFQKKGFGVLINFPTRAQLGPVREAGRRRT